MKLINDNRYKSAYRAESLEDYYKIVDLINEKEKTELWYRGHSKSSYRLLPSIMREAYIVTNPQGQSIAPRKQVYAGIAHGQEVRYVDICELLDKVKAHKEMYPYQVKNDLELIAMCQHHGLITNFMDWTTDKDVGLFFATDQGSSNKTTFEEDIVVFVLNPNVANKLSASIKVDGVISSDDLPEKVINELLYGYTNHTFICLSVPKGGYRLQHQDGRFTWHGYNFTEMDNWGTSNKFLYKIVMNPTVALEVKSHLDSKRITRNFIYGDDTELDTENKGIKAEAENKFKEFIQHLNEEFFKGQD